MVEQDPNSPEKLELDDIVDIESVRSRMTDLFINSIEKSKSAYSRVNDHIKAGAESAAEKMAKTLTMSYLLAKAYQALAGQQTALAQSAGSLRQVGLDTTQSLNEISGTLKQTITQMTQSAGLLAPTDQMESLSRITGSSKVFKETLQDGGSTLKTYTGLMGYMGISVEDSSKTLTDASNEWGASSKDLIGVFQIGKYVAKNTNLSFRDAFNSLYEMNKAVRSLTFNQQAATDLLFATVMPLNQLKFSSDEIKMFSQGLANMLGSLTPSRLAGLMSLKNGRMPTTAAELNAGAKGGMSTFVGAIKPILDKFPKDSANRVFAAQSLAQQYGIGQATTVKGSQALLSIMDQFGTGGKDFQRAMEKFQKEYKLPEDELKDLQKEGFETIKANRTLLETMTNAVTAIAQVITQPLVETMKNANSFMSSKGATALRQEWERGKNAPTLSETVINLVKNQRNKMDKKT